MRLLIAFGNKARNGKDTVVEAIKGFYDETRRISAFHDWATQVPEARIFRFADALYKIAREEYEMTTKDPALLQRIGAERRAVNENYWSDIVEEQLKSFTGLALISDLRYKNEAAMVRRLGGYCVNVKRLNADGSQFITADRPSSHLSEIDLDEFNWDYQLVAKTGETALLGEYAITLAEYLMALTEK